MKSHLNGVSPADAPVSQTKGQVLCVCFHFFPSMSLVWYVLLKTFARCTTSSVALARSTDSSFDINLVAARKVSALSSTNFANTSSGTTPNPACGRKLSMCGLAKNSMSATGCWFHQRTLLPLGVRNPSCSNTLRLHARCLDFSFAFLQRRCCLSKGVPGRESPS